MERDISMDCRHVQREEKSVDSVMFAAYMDRTKADFQRDAPTHHLGAS